MLGGRRGGGWRGRVAEGEDGEGVGDGAAGVPAGGGGEQGEDGEAVEVVEDGVAGDVGDAAVVVGHFGVGDEAPELQVHEEPEEVGHDDAVGDEHGDLGAAGDAAGEEAGAGADPG
jgi:hypothetical protein